MSFPNAQRWQMVVKNSSGLVIFDYTKAHDFVDAIGTTIVDPDDQLTFTESLDLTDFTADLAPGDYTVEANVANYPEIHATGTFHVLDHL